MSHDQQPTTTEHFEGDSIITSVRVEHGRDGGHDTVRAWDGGAFAGKLVVRRGLGAIVARRLVTAAPEVPAIGRMPREPCQKCGEMMHRDPAKPPFCPRCEGRR